MNSWPRCHNCRYRKRQKCGYQPTTRHPWGKSPADLENLGCCGYWHGTDGSTLRQQCKTVIADIMKTRPPA